MGLEYTTVTYNEDRHRIVIDQNARKAIITCFSNISLLRVLGFGKDILTNKNNPNYDQNGHFVDALFLNGVKPCEASLPPLTKRISSIFVYSDITYFVLVGHTQTPLLGYFPVQSKWGEQGYWNFNPLYYVKVKEPNIRTIGLRLCSDTGELISFEAGHVICRLNF